MGDDTRNIILSRRTALIAAALAGVGLATNCSGDDDETTPKTCLSPTSGSGGAQACLSQAGGAGGAQPCLGMQAGGGGSGGAGGAQACLSQPAGGGGAGSD